MGTTTSISYAGSLSGSTANQAPAPAPNTLVMAAIGRARSEGDRLSELCARFSGLKVRVFGSDPPTGTGAAGSGIKSDGLAFELDATHERNGALLSALENLAADMERIA